MARAVKQHDDDDGRVICSMDVEGMPWHDRRVRRESRQAQAQMIHQGDQMTASETRRYIWHAILAGMTIVGVFAATWVLFILFCTNVWFR